MQWLFWHNPNTGRPLSRRWKWKFPDSSRHIGMLSVTHMSVPVLNTCMDATVQLTMNSFSFPWQDFSDISAIFSKMPDSCQIPWHFQVFQTSGHPASDLCQHCSLSLQTTHVIGYVMYSVCLYTTSWSVANKCPTTVPVFLHQCLFKLTWLCAEPPALDVMGTEPCHHPPTVWQAAWQRELFQSKCVHLATKLKLVLTRNRPVTAEVKLKTANDRYVLGSFHHIATNVQFTSTAHCQ